MKRTHAPEVSIYMSLDKGSLQKYFNPNDPGPIHCRQLCTDFHEYLNSSISAAGCHSLINYKKFLWGTIGNAFFNKPFIKTMIGGALKTEISF